MRSPLLVASAALLVAGLSLASLARGGRPHPAGKPLPPRSAASLPNAYDDYRAAIRSLKDRDKIGDAIASPAASSGRFGSRRKPFTLPQKEALLKMNAAALRHVRRAFLHPYCDPALSSGDASFPLLADFRTLSRLLILEGDVKAARGDRAGAVRSYLDALRLGEQIRSDGVWISDLVATAVQALGQNRMRRIIPHLSAEEAKAAVRQMENILALDTPFDKIIEGERRFTLAMLKKDFRNYDERGRRVTPLTREEKEIAEILKDMPTTGDLIARYGKAGTLQRTDAYMQRLKSIVRKPFSERPPEPSPDVYPSREEIRENAQSDLIAVMMGTNDYTWLKSLSNAARKRMLAVRLALHAFWKEHGRYPFTLEELAPGYLRKLPRDPFAPTAPIGYLPQGEKFVLYSVGPDGVDDGGAPIRNPDNPEDGPDSERSRRQVRPESQGDIVAGYNRM
ncbi:MAG: hypothetical protein KY468_15640 [Armatimonadetes bacterium]|nr:hypothetical protein [Armatimonadota bacterium]